MGVAIAAGDPLITFDQDLFAKEVAILAKSAGVVDNPTRDAFLAGTAPYVAQPTQAQFNAVVKVIMKCCTFGPSPKT